jgi:hypothetical protein
MTNLVKSCIKWECALKSSCALYFMPRAQQYFAPPQHSEYCHHYAPRVVPAAETAS